MNCEVYVWISALQCFSLNRSFISSQDLFEVMASVTTLHVKPLDFTLASLALLSLVRFAAVSMSVSQSSNLVESCSLKTGMSCSKEFGGWTVFAWNTRCPCTTVLLLQEVQQVQVVVADGLQLTDSEVHAVCDPGSQLVALLQLLLFDVNWLFTL